MLKKLNCFLISVLIIFILAGCSNDEGPIAFKTNPELLEDVVIEMFTTDYPDVNVYTTMTLYNHIVTYRQYDIIDNHEETHTKILSSHEWKNLLATIDLEAIQTIYMEPRCGNFIESYRIRTADLDAQFGFEAGSPIDTIDNQLEGDVDDIIDMIKILRAIHNRF